MLKEIHSDSNESKTFYTPMFIVYILNQTWRIWVEIYVVGELDLLCTASSKTGENKIEFLLILNVLL